MKKNSPGCNCCPELCVHKDDCDADNNLFINTFQTEFWFEPVEDSPMIPGGNWHSVYSCQIVGQLVNGLPAYGLQPREICTLTYNPSTNRWYGFTDQAPAEPDWPYRWNFELGTNARKTLDPAAYRETFGDPEYCNKRWWISDRSGTPGNALTPDMSLESSSGISFPFLSDSLCYAYEPQCLRFGKLMDWAEFIPKALLQIPQTMLVDFEGLTEQGSDASGTYVCTSFYNPPGSNIPCGDPPEEGCFSGFELSGFEPLPCDPSYTSGYYHFFHGQPICGFTADIGKLGYMQLGSGGLTLFLVGASFMQGPWCGCRSDQRYANPTPGAYFDYWSMEGITFERWPTLPPPYHVQMCGFPFEGHYSNAWPTGSNGPDTITVRFGSWEAP